MIIVTGSVELKPEHRDEAFALGREHSARSRGEPGCIAHSCYADSEAPERMHFFEKWKDAEAVRTHFAVPASGDFVRRISAMAIAQPQIEIFTAEHIELPAG